jgi:hypothetical protein
MSARDELTALLGDAIGELNRQLPRKSRLALDDGAALFGPRSGLDSLGLVNLIVLVEQRVEDRWGVELGLTADALGTQDPAALGTVGAFRDLLWTLLSGKLDGRA